MASNTTRAKLETLSDLSTGALAGHLAADGNQYALPGLNVDLSGTPGNGTAHSTMGKAAFAAAGSTVTITDRFVTAASAVLVQLGGADATLTSVRVTPANGSFTVTGNAAATATTPFTFTVAGLVP